MPVKIIEVMAIKYGKWSLTFSNHFLIEDGMGYPIFRHLLWPVRPVLQERFFGAFFRRLLMILMYIMRIKKSSCLGWRSINGKNYGDTYDINADHWPNIEKIAPSLGDVGKIQINQSIYVQTNPCDKWLNPCGLIHVQKPWLLLILMQMLTKIFGDSDHTWLLVDD